MDQLILLKMKGSTSLGTFNSPNTLAPLCAIHDFHHDMKVEGLVS